MTTEHFDPDGPSRLSRASCAQLLRAALDLTVTPPDVPGLRTPDGTLDDRAAAIAATWAAPLLHLTVDTHTAGVVRTGHVHWAASGTVVSRFQDGRGDDREVRWYGAASFARTVVVAAGIADLPAAPHRSVLAASALARRLAASGDDLHLVTATLVAPEAGTDDLRAPGPRAGTEPVSRAVVHDGDGLRRIEQVGGDRLALLPWSGADEQAWFAQVLTGFRDRLGDDPTR